MTDEDDDPPEPAHDLLLRGAVLAGLAWLWLEMASARLGGYDVPLLDSANLVFHEAGQLQGAAGLSQRSSHECTSR